MIPNAQQDRAEFEWLVESFVRGRVSSMLEIGSSEGISLLNLARAMPHGSKVRSIDLGMPHQVWDRVVDTRHMITEAVAELVQEGYDAAWLVSDSHRPEAVDWARDHGPYDLVFIDGDHTYEGVCQDLRDYGPLGSIAVFHDIGNPYERGPGRLWSELMMSPHPDVLMFSCKHGALGGIGVLCKA